MDNSLFKLLVINGSIQLNDLLSFWLIQEGFTDVYTSASGTSALIKAELINPDIVVTDVDLPDISGFDLCKHLKIILPHVLVLCISHIDNDSNRIKAMEVGADDYHVENGDDYQFLSKIRTLSRLKHLSNQIRNQYAELEKRNNVIERHMQMARKVQMSLIPEIDMDFGDCRMLSVYHPAMGIGGDFYNVLRLSEHCFGIVMGDVAGHGIASSFLTVTLNVMIKNLADWDLSPGDLLFHLNNDMCELFEAGNDDSSLYACVFYAVVDTQNKKIRFANAGLVLPLLADSSTAKVIELEASGSPIGMIADTIYDQQEISYQQGDMVLFFTDGLQDNYYKNQPDEFSKHIKDLLSEMSGYKDMRVILDSICRCFYKIEATKTERMEMDDVSILLCKL
ncbi:MAG: fused response regulator/phosphatase [Defluviitaleaceae bacterium]|nr:fused response regulator/phosphatase [Defluviitaleaceae bacterium]